MTDFGKLSERQRNMLIFMDQYMDESGFPPTIREIGRAANISSTSVVTYNLNKLDERGFLEIWCVSMNDLKHNQITEKIIGAAYDVHHLLGHGFLDQV